MRTIGTTACYALVIMFTLLVPTSAQVSDYTTIDVPGASFILPRGINPEGDIVGFYGVGAATHGFLLHEGIFTDIDVPGASATRPRSINPQGDIAGFYVAGGAIHGFVLVEGSFITVDVPGASSTQVFGINPRGDLVGFYVAGGVTHAFLFHEGAFATIDVPGASTTLASGINARGDIVGQYRLGVPLLASCSTRTVPSPRLMSQAPHPPWPSGSTLGVASLVGTLLGAPLMVSCSTKHGAFTTIDLPWRLIHGGLGYQPSG